MRTIFEIQVAGGACSLIVFYNCKSVIKLNPGFYLSENELYWIVCGKWKTLMVITFLILPKQKFTGATGRAFLFKKVWVFFIINLPRPCPRPRPLNWRRFTSEMSEFWSQNFLIPFFITFSAQNLFMWGALICLVYMVIITYSLSSVVLYH